MHRAHRCTLADTVWAPTSANRTPALRRRPLPGRPPCRVTIPACPTRPTIPRAPRPRIRPTARAQPCAHCTSIAYALLPAARVPLCRHRADPESSSRSLPSGSPARLARIAPTACRRPHPPLALRRPRGHGWQESHRMHPFFVECAKKDPFLATSARNACFSRSRWQHPRPMHPISGRNRAIQDTWRANLAAKGLFSRRGARNHAWREDVASAARPFRGSGMRSGRTGFAPCGAGLACLSHAPLPVISLVPAAACAPCHIARVHRRRLTRVVLRRPHRAHRAQPSAKPPIAVGASRRSGSSCCPRAAHADASRPPQRHRHRPSPNLRQPNPGPEPTGPRPPVEPSAPTRAPPPAAPHPAARVPLRFS